MGKEDLSTVDALARRARVLLISSTVLWGLSFPLVRALELAQRAADPAVSDAGLAAGDVAIRFALAVVFLLPIYGGQLVRVTAREWSQAGGLAFFAAGGLYLQTLGLAWTDASITAFLTQLYCLVVPLIVALRDRAWPSLRVMVACGLVLTGAAMLSPGLLRHFILGPGEIVIIVSTLFMGCQIVWVERPLYAENRPGVVTIIMFAILSGLSAVGFFALGGTPRLAGELMRTPVLWELTLAVVLLCTVFNFLIMNAWQRRIRATEAGLIYCIEPVVAAVLSSFLPGWISRLAGISYANETLSWTLFVGGGLIVGATVLVATEGKRN